MLLAIEVDPYLIDSSYKDELPVNAMFREDLSDLAKKEFEIGKTYRRPKNAIYTVVEWKGMRGKAGILLDWVDRQPAITRYTEISL